MASKRTAMQERFVDLVVSGMERTPAAELAGYSHPARDAYRLMQLPHIRETLRNRRQAAIEGDLAGIALKTLKNLMTEDSTPAATRYQASTWVLKHAGHHTTEDPGSQAKELSEMDAGELSQAIASGMQALTELAGQLDGHHVVDGAPRAVRDVSGYLENEPENADFLD